MHGYGFLTLSLRIFPNGQVLIRRSALRVAMAVHKKNARYKRQPQYSRNAGKFLRSEAVLAQNLRLV